ncbi:hypothetical protein MT_57030 [Pseudomonas phage phiPto-bp6g]|nr:hypothetical protein MT_57030 [Pseudomonas phage phiPto-bp6g]
MKHIGMIFDNQVALNAAFYMHAWSNTYGCTLPDVNVNTGMRTIEVGDRRYSYILIKDQTDVVKISGIEFDAIFSEVTDSHCKQYIMSRFRPRFGK